MRNWQPPGGTWSSLGLSGEKVWLSPTPNLEDDLPGWGGGGEGQSTSWCQFLRFGRNQPWAMRRSLELEVRLLKGVKVFIRSLFASYEMPLLH